jgi:hypothetical protein
MGTKRKYWPKTHDRGETVWQEFVNNHITHKIDEVFDGNPTFVPAEGSFFHLDLNSDSSELLAQLKNLSFMYRIYGCKFVYQNRQGIIEDVLTVFRSKQCTATYDKTEPLLSFIDRNKFSFLHNYDLDELIEKKMERPILLIIVMYELDDAQSKALQNLGGGGFCESISVGWASNRENHEIMTYLNLTYSDLPAVRYLDPVGNCVSSYIGDPVNIPFFLKSIKSEGSCNVTFNGSNIQSEAHVVDSGNGKLVNAENDDAGKAKRFGNKDNVKEFGEGKEPEFQISGAGWVFIAMYCGIAGFLIFMLKWGSGLQRNVYNRIEDEV